jgi:hypothetical protein
LRGWSGEEKGVSHKKGPNGISCTPASCRRGEESPRGPAAGILQSYDEMTNSCMIMKEQREMLDTESFIKKEQRDKCGIRNQ